MRDIERYINKREKKYLGFRKGVEQEYANLRIGVIIKELRDAEGMTQEEFAKKLKTSKSAISRIENHAESLRLSTLERIASVFGKRLIVGFK
jgi:HTH-type transcriptional regulator / antitoxin HipB